MNVFSFRFVGQLAKAVELTPNGERSRARFTLIGNEMGRKNEEGERVERVVSAQFVAFGGLAETLAIHTQKGDQLFVEGHIGNNNWTDKEGTEHYGFNFVVDEFAFGAPGQKTRERLAAVQQ